MPAVTQERSAQTDLPSASVSPRREQAAGGPLLRLLDLTGCAYTGAAAAAAAGAGAADHPPGAAALAGSGRPKRRRVPSAAAPGPRPENWRWRSPGPTASSSRLPAPAAVPAAGHDERCASPAPDCLPLHGGPAYDDTDDGDGRSPIGGSCQPIPMAAPPATAAAACSSFCRCCHRQGSTRRREASGRVRRPAEGHGASAGSPDGAAASAAGVCSGPCAGLPLWSAAARGGLGPFAARFPHACCLQHYGARGKSTSTA